MYYVYILLCADGSFYTGVTNDVEKRYMQHEAGDDPKAYTFRRRPLKLVHREEYSHVKVAIDREKQIKRWSKAKKQALVDGDEAMLVKRAKRRGGR